MPSIDLVLVGVSTLRLAHRKLLRVLLLVSRSASKGPGAASRVTNLFEHAQREQLPLTIRSSDSVEPAAPQDNPRHRPTRTGDADAHTTKRRSRSTTHVNSRWHPSRLRRRRVIIIYKRQISHFDLCCDSTSPLSCTQHLLSTRPRPCALVRAPVSAPLVKQRSASPATAA